LKDRELQVTERRIEFKDGTVFFDGEKLYKKKHGRVEKGEEKTEIRESDNIYKWLTVLNEYPNKELSSERIFYEIDKDPRWEDKKNDKRWMDKKGAKTKKSFEGEFKDFKWGLKRVLHDKGLDDELSNEVIVTKISKVKFYENNGKWVCNITEDEDKSKNNKDRRIREVNREVFIYNYKKTDKVLTKDTINYQLKSVSNQINFNVEEKWPLEVKKALTRDRENEFLHIDIDYDTEGDTWNVYVYDVLDDSPGGGAISISNVIQSNVLSFARWFSIKPTISDIKLLEFCNQESSIFPKIWSICLDKGINEDSRVISMDIQLPVLDGISVDELNEIFEFFWFSMKEVEAKLSDYGWLQGRD